MSFVLRSYQRAAIDAVYRHLRERDDNPVVVMPTGSGKSCVIGQLAADVVTRWNGRVLILAHVRELLEQNADKIRRLQPDLRVGVYSAGLNRRETQPPVIVAGIQSVYQRACELGAFDVIVIDEAHLLQTEGDGMYRQFLADSRAINPQVRVIGLTATPYRLDSGLICSPDHFLNSICYEIGVKELIRDGYLCPLVSKAGKAKADASGLHVRGGEFVSTEVEDLMDQDALVEAACAEIVEQTRDRQAVLIFAAGIKHGQHVARVLQEKHGVECGFVCGETPSAERDRLFARFRNQVWTRQLQIDFGGHAAPAPLKFLCNVGVLTTGFDAPNIDCVVLLRPTMSPGLYCQMVGRGFRLHPGKTNTLILDFGGNVLRHGPVDLIKVRDTGIQKTGEAPAKECPECHSVIAIGYARCPDCGYEFPPRDEKRHEAQASEAGVLSGQVTISKHRVRATYYSVHVKRDASADSPRSMRVDYQVGWHEYKSEWVCLEHTGYARQKAVAWWRCRSPDPIPDTAERAVELAEAGALAPTLNITVRAVAGEPYERIVDYELGEKPAPVPQGAMDVYEESEVPF